MKTPTARTIKTGSRVSFHSKAHQGAGTVTSVESKATGDWYTIKTKDHPAGKVTVRRSQVS